MLLVFFLENVADVFCESLEVSFEVEHGSKHRKIGKNRILTISDTDIL